MKSEAQKTEFMLKYVSVLKGLLRLANFEAICAIEKTTFNKITNKVYKKKKTKKR